MSLENLMSGSIGAFIGALGAFYCAYYAANKNKELDKATKEKKTLDDLYYVVTQLSGFINYFQFACKMNSAFSTQDYQNILNKIKTVDKNILDISQPFFYNSEVKDKVKIELCKFIEDYIGWKGYGALLPVEGLVEYTLINEMEIDAVDCLNEIKAQYSCSKTLANYIDEVAGARENIKKTCLETNDSMKTIVQNLTFLFGNTLFCAFLKKQIGDVNTDFIDIQGKIVCQCFKYIFGNHFFAVKNSEAGKLLFYKEIESIQTKYDTGVWLVDSDKKEYKINDITKYLFGLYKDTK